MKLLQTTDFKKNDTVFHVQPWNFLLSYNLKCMDNETKTLRFKINEYTVHSSGKKVIKFFDVCKNEMVEWQDYFCDRNEGNVYNHYFTSCKEAELFIMSIEPQLKKQLI